MRKRGNMEELKLDLVELLALIEQNFVVTSQTYLGQKIESMMLS